MENRQQFPTAITEDCPAPGQSTYRTAIMVVLGALIASIVTEIPTVKALLSL